MLRRRSEEHCKMFLPFQMGYVQSSTVYWMCEGVLNKLHYDVARWNKKKNSRPL